MHLNNPNIYTATQGERLDSIYFKIYGNNFHQKHYDVFLMQNHKLLKKDFLDGGDEVCFNPKAPDQEKCDDGMEGLYGIQL
ncbi:hypothetical protein BKH41_09325 [Helicobacter sp. 12S02232-10]|uniref:hypothetical protein n=1 Tax=Helicobacter sp. 12S02232-10 TaxID=1476197 RepID=UPI000BD90855|nr:hypothetical protein [Helicobacter sp. 12S02232-10]PAF46298.1 hypothetical protein BKH41_09325 [Helicobacter sp. 12S02232-10]